MNIKKEHNNNHIFILNKWNWNQILIIINGFACILCVIFYNINICMCLINIQCYGVE